MQIRQSKFCEAKSTQGDIVLFCMWYLLLEIEKTYRQLIISVFTRLITPPFTSTNLGIQGRKKQGIF